MCKWGTTTPVQVVIPADLSHTGRQRVAIKNIDACLALIIQALQRQGIHTRACCCGHGQRPAQITLANGKTLTLIQAQSLITNPDTETVS